jgi:small redox-active disulfide protein 2
MTGDSARELARTGVDLVNIKILGSGCPNCKRLEKVTREAMADLGIDAEITKVTEMIDIMSYQILATPGLVINEEVVSSGRVPSKAEVTSMITTALSKV